MNDETPTVATEVERYLLTGDTDPNHAAWPGSSFMAIARRAHDDLRQALVAEVHRLAEGREHPPLPIVDTTAYTRRKVEPMVRGLFPRAEQQLVLGVLAKSVVFVTTSNIDGLLLDEDFHHDAWVLANLYLGSLGAKLLGKGAPRIVGMSVHTTCFVTPGYFEARDPFADFIVHEAAHVFHNCKRETVGLPFARRKEWLLDIKFQKRETFAYSCEAYARVLEQARTAAERRALAKQFGERTRLPEDAVDAHAVAEIVEEAAAARNGWKVILGRCAPAAARRPPQPAGSA